MKKTMFIHIPTTSIAITQKIFLSKGELSDVDFLREIKRVCRENGVHYVSAFDISLPNDRCNIQKPIRVTKLTIEYIDEHNHLSYVRAPTVKETNSYQLIMEILQEQKANK